MKILVTGGAGFIGSHLVDQLVNQNHSVLILDHLMNRAHKKNINPQAQFIKGDILEKALLEKIFSEHQPQIVFHLAALVQSVGLDPKDLDLVNVQGAKNLLDVAAVSSVKKFIFASSVAVYGDADNLPVTENHPLNPVSAYGHSKKQAEDLIGRSKTASVILRFANVYGPRQDSLNEGGVVAVFMRQAKQNQPLVIFGDGQQTRDFIFVADVVNALIKAINLKQSTTINIASNKPTSINHLAEMVIKVAASSSPVKHRPPRSEDILHSWVDNHRAKTVLSWQPRTSLIQGLKIYYDNL
jgi:UDP-glucose 4-epimerase